jgi:hypothetical protein
MVQGLHSAALSPHVTILYQILLALGAAAMGYSALHAPGARMGGADKSGGTAWIPIIFHFLARS